MIKEKLKSISSSQWYAAAFGVLLVILVCVPLKQALLSAFLFICGLGILSAIDLRGIFVLSFPVYALLGSGISLVLIEQGAYISEQERYGWNIGATPVLLAASFGFLLLGHYTLSRLFAQKTLAPATTYPKYLSRLIIVSCLAVGVFYLATFWGYGLGISHEERFVWVKSLPALVAQIHQALGVFGLPILFALAGYAWIMTRDSREWAIFLLIPVASLLLTGEKFSGLISLFLLTIVGIGLAHFLSGKRILIHFRFVLLVAVVCFGLFVSLLIGFERGGAINPFQAITQRLALQGHVWFGTVEAIRSEGLSATFFEIFGPNQVDSPSGLDFVSYWVADPHYVYTRISTRGVTFTMGGPATLVAFFGIPLGTFMFTLTSLLYVSVVRLSAHFFTGGKYISAAASLALYLALNNAVLMGRWDALYGTIVCLIYALLIGFFLVSRFNLRDFTPRLLLGSRTHDTDD